MSFCLTWAIPSAPSPSTSFPRRPAPWRRAAEKSGPRAAATDFIEIFGQTVDQMGERMVYILQEAIDAVMQLPDGNLLDLVRMLSDEPFRRWLVSKVQEPAVRRFWLEDFPARRREYVSSVDALLTRLRHLVGDEAIRSVMCQRQGKLDVPSVLNERKILLVNLNFKAVGASKGSFVGKFLMAELQSAGMARGTSERVEHFVYADEFQNYLCEAFGQVLARGTEIRSGTLLGPSVHGPSGRTGRGHPGQCRRVGRLSGQPPGRAGSGPGFRHHRRAGSDHARGIPRLG